LAPHVHHRRRGRRVLRNRYLYGSIKAGVNPIATFLASLVDLTGFLSGMTRQMRVTVIEKT